MEGLEKFLPHSEHSVSISSRDVMGNMGKPCALSHMLSKKLVTGISLA